MELSLGYTKSDNPEDEEESKVEESTTDSQAQVPKQQ